MEPRYGFVSARYDGSRRGKFKLVECILLTSSLVVILGGGLWILFHTAIKSVHHWSSRSAGIGYHYTAQKSERLVSDSCYGTCTTKDCLKTAAGMISRINSAVDPCEDFYAFSCGKYEKISMDRTKREQFFNDVVVQVMYVVKGIIEQIPKNLPENIPGYSASKARNLYQSCMNFDCTEEMAVPSAFRYLEYFGVKSWPHLNLNYEFTNPNWDEVLVRLTLYDANPFFSLKLPENDEEAQPNARESTKSDLVLEIKADVAGKSMLLTHIFPKEEIVSGMRDVLDYFGLPDENINSTIQDVLQMEEALENIKQISHKRIRECSLNASISCASYRFDCTNERDFEMERWCVLITKVLDTIGMREKFPHVNIVLLDKFYFQDVRSLTDRVNHRSIAHGIALEFFLEKAALMNYHFRRTAVVSLYPKEVTEKLQDDRPVLCVSWVIAHLPTIVGAAFYSAKYKGQLQNEGNDMFEEIKEQVASLVKNMTWIDPEAQDILEKQMQNVTMYLNYYEEYVSNATSVDEFHKQLHVTDQSFLSNMMEIKKFSTIVKFLHHNDESTLIRQRSHFQLSPKYLWEIIYLDFSAFIYPLISANRPRYSNLGTFGYFLSHEYSHGIEIFLRDPENMSTRFEISLEEKKRCLIDQFSQYDINLIDKNVKVNGSFTLYENMADFFAIRQTYQAMKDYQEQHGVEKTLPGLQFNVEQLFFISVAQSLCETNTVETLATYLDDPHSPNKYRILGMMKNFEPFSETFNCPLGSPMNPTEKCYF